LRTAASPFWTGIGTVGTSPSASSGEPATVVRVLCVTLILAGVAGLNAFP
jgi:multidrug transporter EmrE-like cation transporter